MPGFGLRGEQNENCQACGAQPRYVSIFVQAKLMNHFYPSVDIFNAALIGLSLLLQRRSAA